MPSVESVKERVVKTIADQCGLPVAEINDDSNFIDLGLDSLDEVEIAMALEEEFDCELPDEDFQECTNVKSIVEFIHKTVN